MTTTIDLDKITLTTGSHQPPTDNTPPEQIAACVVEYRSVYFGRPFKDWSKDDCPVLQRALQIYNDRWPDEPRQMLKKYIPLEMPKQSRETTLRRALVLVDYTIRKILPIVLEAFEAKEQADRLRELPTIDTRERARESAVLCRELGASLPTAARYLRWRFGRIADDAADAADAAAADAADAAAADAAAAGARAAADAADAAAADAAAAAAAADAKVDRWSDVWRKTYDDLYPKLLAEYRGKLEPVRGEIVRLSMEGLDAALLITDEAKE